MPSLSACVASCRLKRLASSHKTISLEESNKYAGNFKNTQKIHARVDSKIILRINTDEYLPIYVIFYSPYVSTYYVNIYEYNVHLYMYVYVYTHALFTRTCMKCDEKSSKLCKKAWFWLVKMRNTRHKITAVKIPRIPASKGGFYYAIIAAFSR